MQPAPPVPPAPGPARPSRGVTGASSEPVGGTRQQARSDRWEWRRRIRADPRKRRIYRVVVACLGVLLLLLSLLTGWLPGPGGIPLALAGLAVLASEFVWAHHLLGRMRRTLHAFTQWAGRQPRWLRLTGSAGLVACALGGAWLWLVVLGPPAVLPAGAVALLDHLPGVDR